MHIFYTHIQKNHPIQKRSDLHNSSYILYRMHVLRNYKTERERRQRDKEDLPFVVPILQEALAPAFCFIPADLFPLSAKQRGPAKLCVRDELRCKAMHCSPPRPFSMSTAMMRRLPASQCKASASLWQSVLSLSPPTSLSVFYFSHSLSAYAHLYGK